MALTKAQVQAADKKKKAAAEQAAKAAAKKAASPPAPAAAAPAAPVMTGEINLQDLTYIVSATQAEPFYTFSPKEVTAPLLAHNPPLVKVKEDAVNEAGHIATMATDDGIAYVAAKSSPFGAAPPPAAASPFGAMPAASAPASVTGAPAAPAKREMVKPPEGGFKLVSDVPLPPVVRKFGAKAPLYPFASMEIGQSFFVPATIARPNPAKSLASTVASAMGRFSEADGTHVVIKDGVSQTVAKFKKTRQFALRQVDDGAVYGYPGVKGAAVFRVALNADA